MKLAEVKAFTSGTYVGCRPVGTSINLLEGWVRAAGIPAPVTRDSLHVTLLYSRKPVVCGDDASIGSVMAKPTGFTVFSNPGDMTSPLVLLLDCPALSYRHEQLIKKGGTHDYPEYTPHITLTYDIGTFQWQSLVLPDFEIELGNEYWQPLDLSWSAS